MTVETPPGVINDVSTDAKVWRRTTQVLAGGAVGAFAGGVSAVNGGAHGVAGPDHLKVSQSGSPGMSVSVAAGLALITGTVSAEQGPYSFYNDAAVTLSISAADSTNPRRDLVIAQVRDDDYSGADADARLTVVTGTPAASPSDPSLASYPNALVLARVAVAANASSITNANITDLRTKAGRWAQPWGIVPNGYAIRTGAEGGFGTGGGTISVFECTPTFLAGRLYRIKAIIHPDIEATATYATATLIVGGSIVQANGTPLSTGPYTELDLEYVGPAPATGAQAITVSLAAGPSGTVSAVGSSSVPMIMYAEDVGPV